MVRKLFIFLMVFPLGLWAQKPNPHAINWKVGGSLPSGAGVAESRGFAGAVSGVDKNILLVAGGANFPEKMPWLGGKKQFYNSGFAFKKKGDSITAFKIFELSAAIAYAAVTSTGKGIFFGGGENAAGMTAGAFLLQWNPARETVLQIKLPDLPAPVVNAAAASFNNIVYVAGGETGAGASNKFYFLDLENLSRGWAAGPNLPQALSHGVLVEQYNGDHSAIYLAGGRRKEKNGLSTFFGSLYSFDLKNKKWIEKSKLPHPLSAGSGVATGASYILLLGGDKGKVFNETEQLINEILLEQDAAKKKALINRKAELQAAHPGFSKEVLLYNTITDVWTVTDTIPFNVPVTTTAFKWDKDIIIPSGEIKAGVRTPNILIGTPSKRQFFSWLDIVVLIVCFLLMTVARYFFTSSKTTTADYFKGGQKIPRWAAGISIFGAKLSAITFMGIPAKTYATNWTYFFLLMTIIMIMPVIARYFIPFYRKLNVTSAYEYLEKRFNYGARLVASLLYILLQLGRMGIVVLLPSIALTLVTGINVNLCILLIGMISIYFTVKGGIEAVIWVEVIQVLILAGGALLCLFYIPFHLDNLSGAIEAVKHYDKLKTFEFRFNLSEPTFWVVVIGGLAINLVTYGTDQTTVQRYMTTKSENDAVKSLRLGAWLTLPSTLVFFSIGTLLFLFFRQHPDQVNDALENGDNIFPWFIVSQLPAGLSGLLIAGIFAAAMSSTEASMNSVATLLTTDFYKKCKPAVTEKQTLFFARVVTLCLGIFVTAIALYMAHQGVSSLWDKFNTILGLFTGCIGGAFLLGIFTQKANGQGVVLGMIGSFFAQLAIQQFTALHLLMYAFTGLVSCLVLGYFFSLFFHRHKAVKGLTYATLKQAV